ncbi:hypothetical protein BS50DRAFT_109737 [Corynespora cassiicola Philippines]|uniref:Uncharacterized protein n=1 Tax=Corynespora cassiicola Philippines TaxID=1448308 RepID=A0A2T2ND31_CORCC|nr:hypothetical protein BS50DRAFT_109737 [Corynespora cassiicola Philippines]
MFKGVGCARLKQKLCMADCMRRENLHSQRDVARGWALTHSGLVNWPFVALDGSWRSRDAPLLSIGTSPLMPYEAESRFASLGGIGRKYRLVGSMVICREGLAVEKGKSARAFRCRIFCHCPFHVLLHLSSSMKTLRFIFFPHFSCVIEASTVERRRKSAKGDQKWRTSLNHPRYLASLEYSSVFKLRSPFGAENMVVHGLARRTFHIQSNCSSDTYSTSLEHSNPCRQRMARFPRLSIAYSMLDRGPNPIGCPFGISPSNTPLSLANQSQTHINEGTSPSHCKATVLGWCGSET